MPEAPRHPVADAPPGPHILGAGMAHSHGVRHVFVYGTLRRGEVNDIHRLRPSPCPCGWARVAGDLYQLGWYPGLRLGAHGPMVIGELYEIDPLMEARLDAIEEIRGQPDDEYRKVLVTVQRLAGGPNDAEPATDWATAEPRGQVRALLYEVQAHRMQGTPRIASGDWRRR